MNTMKKWSSVTAKLGDRGHGNTKRNHSDGSFHHFYNIFLASQKLVFPHIQ